MHLIVTVHLHSLELVQETMCLILMLHHRCALLVFYMAKPFYYKYLMYHDVALVYTLLLFPYFILYCLLRDMVKYGIINIFLKLNPNSFDQEFSSHHSTLPMVSYPLFRLDWPLFNVHEISPHLIPYGLVCANKIHYFFYIAHDCSLKVNLSKTNQQSK